MPAEVSNPKVIVIAGPNGAGKSTAAPELLHGTLAVNEFVNADVIARGLSAFEPERVAIQAGRIMLARLDELAKNRISFAFETTLASRSFAPWISDLKATGYLFHLIYLWLPGADLAISRVAARVRQNGHHVPDDVVRRRYARGLDNFFMLYMPLATSWTAYYNAVESGPELIAEGGDGVEDRVLDIDHWKQLKADFEHGQD
jgi:predicted ABC-type ATPase